MSDNEPDEMGPVDYLVVEFPAGQANFSGEVAAELAGLSQAGTIRVLDLLILVKDSNGTVEAHEVDDFDLRHRPRVPDEGDPGERDGARLHRM